MKIFLKAGLTALLFMAVAAVPSLAQTQKRVDAKRDWAIFEAGEGAARVCWIVSSPKTSTATRGGKQVEVRRGKIFLMISVRPADGVKNEVSFLAGYPFKKGSEVKIGVGSKSFAMITEGENAWSPSAADDVPIIEAFRAGASAEVEGVSARGTVTSDSFSLLGFTAALEAAQDRCK